MKNTIIIIQARMSSTRLPRKILKSFYHGRHILEIQLDIIRHVLPDIPAVVATTVNSADNAIEDFCKDQSVICFRGSEADVLQRFIDCGEEFQAKNVIRVCSDNPFLSGEYLEKLYTQSLNSGADYWSYRNSSDMPAIKTHWGLFAEMVTLAALKKAASFTNDSFYHEHVTNFIYGNPMLFKVVLEKAPAVVFNRNDLRFTIDTPNDFEMAQVLFSKHSTNQLTELIKLVDEDSEVKIVMQRGIEQFSK